MTEKELKKLTRYQLLELLITQTERADALEERVAELEKQLESRNLKMSKLGSIAEAAVHISGVMEAAQQAADMYQNSAKKHADETLARARRQAAAIVARAEAKARSIENTPRTTAGKVK